MLQMQWDSDLGYFGVQALAHLHPPMGHQHGAVRVDVHQGGSLVQELGGEGDAELGGDDSQAALAPPVGPVELICRLLPLGKMCVGDDAIPAGLCTAYTISMTVGLHPFVVLT